MANPGMEVLNIKSKIAGASPGIAYISKQKLEKILKEDIEKLTDSWFKDFFGRVSKYSDEIIIEKNRKQDKEKVMLLNLSCLVNKTKIEALGDELGIINNMEGLSVHFSGPWPPYSFVNKTFVNAGNKDNGTY
jgi:isocitrate dehydrogenase